MDKHKIKFETATAIVYHIQVRFINFIPMQFFHKSLHTPLCIPTSAARYLMSKINYRWNKSTDDAQPISEGNCLKYCTTEILW